MTLFLAVSESNSNFNRPSQSTTRPQRPSRRCPRGPNRSPEGLLSLASFLIAQQTQPDVQLLESRVEHLESEIEDVRGTAAGAYAVVFFLFGAFCALWAQYTGRSAWGWFFLGLFFGPITVIVLLVKHRGDKERASEKVGASHSAATRS